MVSELRIIWKQTVDTGGGRGSDGVGGAITASGGKSALGKEVSAPDGGGGGNSNSKNNLVIVGELPLWTVAVDKLAKGTAIGGECGDLSEAEGGGCAVGDVVTLGRTDATYST